MYLKIFPFNKNHVIIYEEKLYSTCKKNFAYCRGLKKKIHIHDKNNSVSSKRHVFEVFELRKDTATAKQGCQFKRTNS